MQVIIEPTRNAWVPLAAWLSAQGADVVLVAPEQSADLRDYYNKHTKTDRLDSRVLARLPLLHPEGLAVYDGPTPADPLRRVMRRRSKLVKARVATFQRLDALLDFQLGRGVTQRQKMSVWFAYYGEAGARPVYQKIVSTVDRLAAQKLEALFTDIIREGGYQDVDARELATGYSALIDGLHLGLLVTPRELSKRRARTVACDFLRRAFPRHID